MRSHQIGTCGQCDQIGQFIKFLETKFQTKEAQIIINSLGYFEKPHNYVKTAVATSWVNLKTFGLLLLQHLVTLLVVPYILSC